MAMRAGSLDTALLRLSDKDYFDLRSLAQNVFVTGVTGGGKTSGPGRHLLSALLKSGAGGIILCAKPGEADEIYALCEESGRAGSVIRWNGRNHGFNFLAYALARLGPDGANGVVEYFMRVIEMVRTASPMPGGNGDSFWLDALRVLLRYSLPVVHAATGRLDIADIISFVRSAPTAPGQMSDPEWQRTQPFFLRCFMQAAQRLDDETGNRMATYWRDDFSKMDGKLRSNILAGFAMLDRFNHGWLRDATCGATTIVPALCFHGAIIIVDLPRSTMGEDGIVLQLILKDAWQTEVLARNALPSVHRERFVFCYADECQEFVTSSDADFLAMSRSSLAGTIYLTQSLPSLYSKLGGQNAHDRAHHLISNFGVRIFCANSCPETNEWAAKTIGRSLQSRANYSQNEGYSQNRGMNMGESSNWGQSSQSGGSSSSGKGGGSSGSSWSSGSSSGASDSSGRNLGRGTSHGQSWGGSMVMDHAIEPGAFGFLKSGGPAHAYRVGAIWYQPSRTFAASGSNTLYVEFTQK